MPLCNDITKDREIRFTCSLTNADQAQKAVQLLSGIAGIELATPTRPNILRVRYDIRKITLQMLEAALVDVGFNLHNNLSMRFKRELIAYCEGALRSSLGIEINDQDSPPLTLNRPATSNHLDPRPDNWRNYV